MLKKPTLVEITEKQTADLTPKILSGELKSTIETPSMTFPEPLAKKEIISQSPPPEPSEQPPVTMADLMMELSIIGEVFAKRKLFAVTSLRHQNGHFNLTCSWKDAGGQAQAFVGRKITDSLTPKGLALVVGELKLAVGI